MMKKSPLRGYAISQEKKGQMHIMILVIGVIIICALAVFSFVFFSGDGDFSKILAVTEKMRGEIEKYNFYKNSGLNPEEILHISPGENGKFLEEQGDGIIIKYYILD